MLFTVSIHAPARGATREPLFSVCGFKFQSTPPRGGRRKRAGCFADHVAVSIHAPARGATSIATVWFASHKFQSTPPRGGRHVLRPVQQLPAAVSIHAPARGATWSGYSHASVVLFQSTPPRGGRPQCWAACLLLCGFNPRPREGGDGYREHRRGAVCVSIHAPARGATVTQKSLKALERFQSTPPRGGRPPSVGQPAYFSAVSIHAPARGATLSGGRAAKAYCVSIHAPARGATSTTVRRVEEDEGFNPRPREGGDEASSEMHSMSHSFNPRPREGGDQVCLPWCSSPVLFQSTPPRGGRPEPGVCCSPWEDVSIHAPARGATRPGRLLNLGTRFQSTPPRGGRRSTCRGRLSPPCFNPRPREGGDLTETCMFAAKLVSIHAPARGATPHTKFTSARKAFQSTPPRGGRPPRDCALHRPSGRFNPRPREGGDIPKMWPDAQFKVSIHAPARGATF